MTILFCLIGLPIAIVFVKTLGELISKAIKNAIVKLEKVFLKRVESRNLRVKCFLVTLAAAGFLMFVAGIAESLFHGLSFVEGIYLWFTTMTTIGFGDYIPALIYRDNLNSQNSHRDLPISVICLLIFISSLPLWVGLSIMAAVLNSLADCFEDIKSYSSKIWTQISCPRVDPQRNSPYEVRNAVHLNVNHSAVLSQGMQSQVRRNSV